MDNRYRIEHAFAGEGGYGRIDKAFDSVLERPVAIKTLDPLFKESPTAEDVERFHREAKSLAQLSHPNIPAIYDVQFSPDKSEFRIIFEWIEGRNLREHLMDQGVLSLHDARDYFIAICSTLTHAHSKGIIHRDIKPPNVILSARSRLCYLVDLGIALRKDDLSRLTRGTPIGTSGYMSPEQERGEEVSSASDVFSLGVLLYECLAGGRPTVGAYKSLGLHNESIPPAVDALILQALSEDALQRPSTAREFSERLTAALQPHASFSSTLADGSLYEIRLGLSQMTPTDFNALPPGQRVLLITRLVDLVRVDEPTLRPAAAALVTELVRLTHMANVETYRSIVGYAFEFGYDKQFGEKWHGNGPARTALNDVARMCGQQAHEIISDAALSRIADESLRERARWYFHDLRILLQMLLVNPACGEDHASTIGDALVKVNELSH
jgi:serine/threonine-protein kinase